MNEVAPHLKAVPDVRLEDMTDDELQVIVDAGTKIIKFSSGGDLEIAEESLQRTVKAKDALAELNRRRLRKQ